ncbi:hypothetical protein GPN2_10521 [Streptomyces murinus]
MEPVIPLAYVCPGQQVAWHVTGVTA